MQSTDTSQDMPQPGQITQLISELTGAAVTSQEGTPLTVTPGVALSVAEVVDDTGSVTIVLVSDLQLTCHVGAALTMLQRDTAESWIEDGRIDETIEENYREVLNVLTSVFNQSGGLHFRLQEHHITPGPLPPRPHRAPARR